jgi:hypothetical protein
MSPVFIIIYLKQKMSKKYVKKYDDFDEEPKKTQKYKVK